MKRTNEDDARMLQEAIDCAESALHYVDALPYSRTREANIKRLEATLASLFKARKKLQRGANKDMPEWE